MSARETDEHAPADPGEETARPVETHESSTLDVPPPDPGASRRTFLKAAVLGTAAAAALIGDGDGLVGLPLGPATAFANDLSGNPCTAQDVEIVGTGVVLNEPCVCSGGTFNATVQFTVRNNTSTGRYCIALHLPDGYGIPGQDVILRDSGGSSTAPGKSGGASFRDTI